MQSKKYIVVLFSFVHFFNNLLVSLFLFINKKKIEKRTPLILSHPCLLLPFVWLVSLLLKSSSCPSTLKGYKDKEGAKEGCHVVTCSVVINSQRYKGIPLFPSSPFIVKTLLSIPCIPCISYILCMPCVPCKRRDTRDIRNTRDTNVSSLLQCAAIELCDAWQHARQ